MNYLAHCLVATSIYPEADLNFYFGAMAPNFAHLAAIRLKISPKSVTPFAEGIRLHYATDNAFNSLPEVRQLRDQVHELLATVSLPYGPKTAIIDFSAQMLLDGFILDHHPGVLIKHNQAVARIANTPSLTPRETTRTETAVLQNFAVKQLQLGVPDYRLPYQIALRIHQRLKISRGLGFPLDLIPEIASIMAGYQIEVRKVSSTLLANTIAQLA